MLLCIEKETKIHLVHYILIHLLRHKSTGTIFVGLLGHGYNEEKNKSAVTLASFVPLIINPHPLPTVYLHTCSLINSGEGSSI